MREPDRIVRLKTVLARTGLSRSTIYRKIAEGTFPAQLKISTNGTGWHESDINRWIADPVLNAHENEPTCAQFGGPTECAGKSNGRVVFRVVNGLVDWKREAHASALMGMTGPFAWPR